MLLWMKVFLWAACVTVVHVIPRYQMFNRRNYRFLCAAGFTKGKRWCWKGSYYVKSGSWDESITKQTCNFFPLKYVGVIFSFVLKGTGVTVFKLEESYKSCSFTPLFVSPEDPSPPNTPNPVTARELTLSLHDKQNTDSFPSSLSPSFPSLFALLCVLKQIQQTKKMWLFYRPLHKNALQRCCATIDVHKDFVLFSGLFLFWQNQRKVRFPKGRPAAAASTDDIRAEDG